MTRPMVFFRAFHAAIAVEMLLAISYVWWYALSARRRRLLHIAAASLIGEGMLISADTYHLVKQLFEFKPRGATKVKGKSTPIETYEVLAPKTVPGRVRGLEDVTSLLVGRDAEVQVLREKLKGLLAGQGAVVAVVGEAGQGKSRLIAEVRKLVNTAPQRQVVWLEGRTISVEPPHGSRGGRRIRGRLGR
jgi:AAA ATPase domain